MLDIPTAEFDMAASTPGASGLLLLQVGVVWLGEVHLLFQWLMQACDVAAVVMTKPALYKSSCIWASQPSVGWWYTILYFQALKQGCTYLLSGELLRGSVGLRRAAVLKLPVDG